VIIRNPDASVVGMLRILLILPVFGRRSHRFGRSRRSGKPCRSFAWREMRNPGTLRFQNSVGWPVGNYTAGLLNSPDPKGLSDVTTIRLPCSPLPVALLLHFAFLTGCNPSAPSPVKEKGAPKPVPVKTVSVEQTDLPRTTVQPATVHAFYRAEIRAKVTGYVAEVKADIGDYVKAGATLAVVDVPEMEKQRQVIQARIARGRSEERRARAGVDLAAAHVLSAEAMVAQARSELNRAEATLAAMEAEFERTRDLVQRQSLESRMLDEVRKKRDSEIANREATASAIQSAEADVTVAKARKNSAEADLEAARAQTAIAERQREELDVLMAYATVQSPFAGVVTHRSVDPGDLVRQASEVGKGEALFLVSQVDKVRVRVPVPEADAALVGRGDVMTLRIPSFPSEKPIEATVTRLSGDLDPSTRTMLVEAEIPNPERKLLPGMFGEASIELNTKVAANVLPARAVRFAESGEAYVYIVADDHTVSVSPVTTGIDKGHTIEVTSGVEPGQRVIDAHLKRFVDGQKVTIVKN